MAASIGLALAVALYAGWLRPSDPESETLIFGITAVLLFVGGGLWACLEAWTWIRDRLPSSELRDAVAAEAGRFGLRSVRDDSWGAERDFPLFEDHRPLPAWAVALGALLLQDLGARVEWTFAGTWKAFDVKVFDFSYSKDDTREKWTCAILDTDLDVRDVEIKCETIGGRVKSFLGQRDINVGDDEFDRAFHVRAHDKDDALRILTPTVRARISEDASPARALIQFRERRMLYCWRRIPVEHRNLLLESATRLREALPAG